MRNYAVVRGRYVPSPLLRTTHGTKKVSGLLLLRNLSDHAPRQVELSTGTRTNSSDQFVHEI